MWETNECGFKTTAKGSRICMSHKEVLAKVGKLQAMTEARGASPAEAATAASLARRLVSQIVRRTDPDPSVHSALAPGVHINVVSRKVVRTAHC